MARSPVLLVTFSALWGQHFVQATGARLASLLDDHVSAVQIAAQTIETPHHAAAGEPRTTAGTPAAEEDSSSMKVAFPCPMQERIHGFDVTFSFVMVEGNHVNFLYTLVVRPGTTEKLTHVAWHFRDCTCNDPDIFSNLSILEYKTVSGVGSAIDFEPGCDRTKTLEFDAIEVDNLTDIFTLGFTLHDANFVVGSVQASINAGQERTICGPICRPASTSPLPQPASTRGAWSQTTLAPESSSMPSGFTPMASQSGSAATATPMTPKHTPSTQASPQAAQATPYAAPAAIQTTLKPTTPKPTTPKPTTPKPTTPKPTTPKPAATPAAQATPQAAQATPHIAPAAVKTAPTPTTLKPTTPKPAATPQAAPQATPQAAQATPQAAPAAVQTTPKPAGAKTTPKPAPAAAQATPAPALADTASSFGDPHIANLKGERFDILNPGNHTFLVIPRGVKVEKALLHVVARVDRHGKRCSDGLYIVGLVFTGEWLGSFRSFDFSTRVDGDMNAKKAIQIKVGNHAEHFDVPSFKALVPAALADVSELHPQVPKTLGQHATTLLVKLRLGPCLSKVRMVYQREKVGFSNSLWLTTTGLRHIGPAIGGILGVDPHNSAENVPKACIDPEKGDVMRPGTGHNTMFAVASLDDLGDEDK